MRAHQSQHPLPALQNHGCYLFHHVWNGDQRDSERGEFYHPKQKAVALWRWVLGVQLKFAPGTLVLDPYASSSSIGLACQELGLHYIGVEIDPHYFDVAVGRLAATPCRKAGTTGALSATIADSLVKLESKPSIEV
jgi:DNA modification methylase